MVVSLFVSIAVARYLGPEDFGLYHYVLSIVALVSVITNLGLHSLAKRELVEHPEQRDTILGTCFVLNLFAGLIAYAAMLWIVSVVSDSSLTLGLFALLGGGLLLGPLKCIEVWFQSQVRSDLSFWASSLSLSLFAAAKVAAIFLQADLLGFAYIFLCELVVLTGLQVFLYRRHFGRLLAWRPERRLAMDYLKQAWPLLLSGLAVTVYMKIDQVMLGAMLGDVAVGQYSVAVRISSIWYFVPTLLATSLFPAILNARKQSGQLYTSRLQHYFDLNAGLAYLVCLPLSLAAPWIIALLFGADYAAAAPILTIHAWSSIFVFLGVARGQYLLAEKMFKFAFACALAGAITNIGMNFVLIPRFGGLGAAIATLVSYAISAVLSSVFLSSPHAVFKRQLLSLLVPRLLLSRGK